jgi:hypothetical protein
MREVMCICAVERALEKYEKRILVVVSHIYDGIFWSTPTHYYTNLKIREAYFSPCQSKPIYLLEEIRFWCLQALSDSQFGL